MDNNLIEIFGQMVKTSRDTGLEIPSNYKNNLLLPKAPDDEQSALIDLIKSLDEEQFQQLTKGIKYCIELSLFKLISTVENGVGNYSFSLSIDDGNNKTELVGKEIEQDLSLEYWNWIG